MNMRWKLNYQGRSYYWSVKRFVVNMMIAVLFIAGFIMLANSVTAGTVQTQFSVMVHQGDSLWSIAREIDPERDPRLVIQQIKWQNNLSTANLTAGQRLKISITDN